MADRLDHAYPIDFRKGMRIDSVLAYAQAHDEAYLRERFISEITALLNRDCMVEP